MAAKENIYVKWWGTYSNGGNEPENKNASFALVMDGTDKEIRKEIEEYHLSGSVEDYHSDHWRGVQFRRLTDEETKWLKAREFEYLATSFFKAAAATDMDIVRHTLQKMAVDPKTSYQLDWVRNELDKAFK